jgi:hypothetical protein
MAQFGREGMNRTEADEALLVLARMAMDASVRAADDLGGPFQLRNYLARVAPERQ